MNIPSKPSVHLFFKLRIISYISVFFSIDCTKTIDGIVSISIYDKGFRELRYFFLFCIAWRSIAHVSLMVWRGVPYIMWNMAKWSAMSVIIIPDSWLGWKWFEYMWSVSVSEFDVICVGLVIYGIKPWDITLSMKSFVFCG